MLDLISFSMVQLTFAALITAHLYAMQAVLRDRDVPKKKKWMAPLIPFWLAWKADRRRVAIAWVLSFLSYVGSFLWLWFG